MEDSSDGSYQLLTHVSYVILVADDLEQAQKLELDWSQHCATQTMDDLGSTSEGHLREQGLRILDLPAEMIGAVFEKQEDLGDILALRLTCRDTAFRCAKPSSLANTLNPYALTSTIESIQNLRRLVVSSQELIDSDSSLKYYIKHLVVENVMPPHYLNMDITPVNQIGILTYAFYQQRCLLRQHNPATGRLIGNAVSMLPGLQTLEYIEGFHETRSSVSPNVWVTAPALLATIASSALNLKTLVQDAWRHRHQLYVPIYDVSVHAHAVKNFHRTAQGALDAQSNNLPLEVRIKTMGPFAMCAGSATADPYNPIELAQWSQASRLRVLIIKYLGQNMCLDQVLLSDLNCLCNKSQGLALQFQGLTKLAVSGHCLYHNGALDLSSLGKENYMLDLPQLSKLGLSYVLLGMHAAEMPAKLNICLVLHDVHWLVESFEEFKVGSRLRSVEVLSLFMIDRSEKPSSSNVDGNQEEADEENAEDVDEVEQDNNGEYLEGEKNDGYTGVWLMANSHTEAYSLWVHYDQDCAQVPLTGDDNFVPPEIVSRYLLEGGVFPPEI